MKSRLKNFVAFLFSVVCIIVLFFGVLYVGTRVYAHVHTEYASDYSYWKFRKVQIGSSEQEVYHLLGQPLEVLPYKNCIGVFSEAECLPVSGHYFLLYSRQDPVNTDYFIRHLEIKNGIVIGITSGFYAD